MKPILICGFLFLSLASFSQEVYIDSKTDTCFTFTLDQECGNIMDHPGISEGISNRFVPDDRQILELTVIKNCGQTTSLTISSFTDSIVISRTDSGPLATCQCFQKFTLTIGHVEDRILLNLFGNQEYLSNPFISQSWAPVGATWHYGEGFFWHPLYIESYLQIYSEKDTVIEGIFCRKLVKNDVIGCGERPLTEFMYGRGDKVYFYDDSLGRFQTLYDFRAEPGDTWFFKVVTETTDTVRVRVTDVDTFFINEIPLKRLKVIYEYIQSGEIVTNYPSEIIESIGDVAYMFNFLPRKHLRVCDGNFSSGLRCYSDYRIGLFQTDLNKNCEYIRYVGVDYKKGGNEPVMKIYPVPADNYIYVKHHSPESLKYRIIDHSGQIKQSGNIVENGTDISTLFSGVYLIIIYNRDYSLNLVQKILKL